LQQILAGLTNVNAASIKKYLELVVDSEIEPPTPQSLTDQRRESVEKRLASVAEFPANKPGFLDNLESQIIIAVCFWPAIWTLWSLVIRVGVGCRMHDMTLVRSDGRPAGRLRCAWRTLLVWAPVAGLLTISIHWTVQSWAALETISPASSVSPRLAQAAWWLGVALLPLWLAIALRYPRRGPHDWLAGAYVVPR
jgi:hypothetical protein